MVGPEPWINSFHPWVIGSATIRSIQPRLGDTLCISIQPRTVGSAHPSCFPVFCSGRPAVGMVKSKHPSSSKSSKKEDGYKKEEAATGKLKVKKTVEKKQKEKKMPSTHKDSKTKSMPGKRRPETQDAKDTTKKAKVQNDAHAKAVKASRTEKIHKIGEEKKKRRKRRRRKTRRRKTRRRKTIRRKTRRRKARRRKTRRRKARRRKRRKQRVLRTTVKTKRSLAQWTPPLVEFRGSPSQRKAFRHLQLAHHLAQVPVWIRCQVRCFPWRTSARGRKKPRTKESHLNSTWRIFHARTLKSP